MSFTDVVTAIEAMIEEGTFRRDLYERLNQVTIDVPPLRNRGKDIPDLARRFVGDWNKKYSESKSISMETMDYLKRYPWPGNVRELANTIAQICAVARG